MYKPALNQQTLPRAVDQTSQTPYRHLSSSSIRQTSSWYRPVLIAAVVIAGLRFIVYPTSPYSRTSRTMSTSTAGWHQRAALHPSRDTFVPEASSLKLGVLKSMPVRTSLTVAIFDSDFVIDREGRVLKVTEDDLANILKLANEATDSSIVPPIESFPHQWRVAHTHTSQPIRQLTVKGNAEEWKEVEVYGWGESRTLQRPVDGITELPDALQNVFGAAAEGEKTDRSEDGNEALAKRVVELIQELGDAGSS